MISSNAKNSQACSYILPVIIVILAGAVRLPGCFSDLWLDEIWTLNGCKALNSATEIFTKIRHDNNHHLNTLIVFLLGEQKFWAIYRIHSLISGIGTVILAWLIARRSGRLEGILALLLIAGSYLMIYFSSEARGYAMVVFFGLATFLALRRFVENGSWLNAVIFWICVCLGFLSHLTFLHVFIACAAWLIIHLLRTSGNKRHIITSCAKCFAVPTVFLICFYIFALRGLAIGGGPDYKLYDILVETLSYAAGGILAGPLAVVTGAVFLGLLLWAIVHLRQKGGSEWVFYLFVVFLSPVAILLLRHHPVMFVRYFLISIAFGLLAVSYLLADLYRRGRVGKIFVAIILVHFFVGNSAHVVKFFRYGRGQYLEGLRYIAAQTAQQRITIASDQDFRNGALIEYYKQFLEPEKTIIYIPQARLSAAQSPMWVIIHHIGERTRIRSVLADPYGNTYKLVKTLPYSGPSGYYWFLYQQQHPELGRYVPNKSSQ